MEDQPQSGEVLTTEEAAMLLGLSTSTLNKWRVYGKGPKFLKLGRAVRYRKHDLNAFLVARTRQSTKALKGTAP